jgi:D-galactarolactone isomerase
MKGACDSHLHFYDSSYAVASTATLRPPDATTDDYRLVQQQIGLERLVIVQPTTYGLDNRCQLAAMAEFGDDARGVMVVDTSTTDDELRRLTDLGVRGARFHMLPGGAVGWEMLEPVAARIAPYGWHIQLQVNGRELAERRETLTGLPVDIVIDHFGRFMPPVDADDPNFVALLDLVGTGRAWVKLSAPYESSTQPISNRADDHSDLDPVIDTLVTQAPERLLWATNWPHPGQRTRPTESTLTTQLERWVPDPATRRQILVHNPDRLYFHDRY